MKQDIEIPVAKHVHLVAIREWDKEFLSQSWYVYLVNLREDTIQSVLVVSRGQKEDVKTSVIRRNLGDIGSYTAPRVELITDEVLGFTNEYLVTFFANGKLYERNFVFEPNSISESNYKEIKALDCEGVYAS